jgi:hypothetical protein
MKKMRRFVRALLIGCLPTVVLISGCSGQRQYADAAGRSGADQDGAMGQAAGETQGRGPLLGIRPDDYGTEWTFRFQITPVIPNPFK